MLGSRKMWTRLAGSYGMAGVLVLLATFFSLATLGERRSSGERAAEEVAKLLDAGPGSGVLIVSRAGEDDRRFARRLKGFLEERKAGRVETVEGGPPEVREALEKWAAGGSRLDTVAATGDAADWIGRMIGRIPVLSTTKVVSPPVYHWPIFLTPANLLNVANQIVVIALVAVGMTLVIVGGGIDLSVGSLVALAAVLTALFIERAGGGPQATPMAMVLASLGAIASCGAVGAFSGIMITAFRIPPFIATLAMMQVASGLAFIASEGQTIYKIPDSVIWLGRGADISIPLGGNLVPIPNAVILMVLVYALAWVVMAHTRFGRYVYAVGGNPEAARLSGVRVGLVLVMVYFLCGITAGLGGVIMTSQLKGGGPKYGEGYELYVIAAVVVGGTSLAGGAGKVLGTLIGAFIIAVIQNGMNLTNVPSYHQKVVLGLVILGAVLLDMLRKGGGWRRIFRGWMSAPRTGATPPAETGAPAVGAGTRS
jgi:ribose transport system permease protein